MTELHHSQRQNSNFQDVSVSGSSHTITFAPVQNTKIETQILQISTKETTQREFIQHSPYQGLIHFNIKDRDRFFGRDRLIQQLLEAINSSPLTLTTGASGSGKSSVMRAGVIPEFRKALGSKQFYDFVFTPGEDPFASLYRCLTNDEKDYQFSETKAKVALRPEAGTLLKVVEQLKTRQIRWFWFIDQFEELFTNCSEDKIRHAFLQGLANLIAEANDTLRVVLGMRADFQEYFSYYSGWSQLINDNSYIFVGEMHPQELRQAIEQPAAQHGVVFEERLVKQIIKDVQGQKGYLPLLQYTLDLLWENSFNGENPKTGRELTLSEYNRLGGVQVALQKQADEIFDNELSEIEQKVAKRIFLQLTQLKEHIGRTSRRAYKNEFITQEYTSKIVDSVVQKLVSNRLVVTDRVQPKKERGELPSIVVEMAHESLIHHWSRLNNWLKENQEMLQRKQEIEIETRKWIERGEPSDRENLLRGIDLDLAEDFNQKYPGQLSNEAVKLIELSQEARHQARLEEIEAQVTLERERQEKETAQRARRTLQAANKKAKRRIRIGLIFLSISILLAGIFLGTANTARYKQQVAEQGTKLEQAGVSALRQLRSGELEALLSAMQSGWQLQELIENNMSPQEYPAASPILALQKILDLIYERNRFDDNEREIKTANFSPNGQTVATAGRDGIVRIWNLSGVKQLELQGHQEGILGGINEISFSPNSGKIVSAGGDGTVRLWDTSGKQLAQMEHPSVVNTVSFSPNGQSFASGDDYGIVRLWNLSETKKVQFKHPAGVNNISFSSDGQKIATAGKDGTVRLWNLSGKQLGQFQGHNQEAFQVTFSPDGQRLATAGDNNTVRIWNLSGHELQQLKGHQSWVLAVSFSPDGERLATAGDGGTVRLWERSGREIARLQGHRGTVWSVNFSPNGQYLVTAGRDGTSRLWDLSTPTTLKFPGHKEDVNSVSFGPDGKQIVGAGNEGIVRVWNLSGKQLAQWVANPRGTIWSVRYSPDGETIATAGAENTVRLWDSSGKPRGELKGHKRWVNSISFSPNSKLIITSGADKTARLWDISGELLVTFKKHKAVVGKIAFSPNGRQIASTDWDGKIKLWDISGQLQQEWQGHEAQIRSVDFSPDGNQLVTVDNNSVVRLWDSSGRKHLEFFSYQSGINAVSFSPNGEYIATGGMDGTVRIWDLQGRQLAEFKNEKGAVWGLSFSPDGHSILAGGDMGSLQLWQLQELDELLVAGCKWLKGYLVTNSENVQLRKFCQKQM
jgi:WD40 repeat protein